MSATACALLRHDVRPRWVGDLLAQWCHTCQPGHLLIAEPTPAIRVESPLGPDRSSGRPADPATVATLLLAVT